MWFEFEELDVPISGQFGAGMFEGKAWIDVERNGDWIIDQVELMCWQDGKKVPVTLGHEQRWLADKIESGLKTYRRDDVEEALYHAGHWRKTLRDFLGLSSAQRGVAHVRVV